MATKGISVIIPCLNERGTIKEAILEAFEGIRRSNLVGEVIVADNGSTDGSVELALSLGAQVVHVLEKGYGNAVNTGLLAGKYEYLIFADADLSYNFLYIPEYVSNLQKGYDLVLGNRLKGTHEAGAMPFLNRHLGTPILSFFIRWFYKIPIFDCNSGMRGIRKTSFSNLHLVCPGMEYASEMLIESSRQKLKYFEFPMDFRKDKRGRPPHLRRWRDGWRHLRFILGNSSSKFITVPSLLLGSAFFFSSILIGINGLSSSSILETRYHSAIVLSVFGILLYFFGISSFFTKVAIEGIRKNQFKTVSFGYWLEARGIPILTSLVCFILGSLSLGFIAYRWAKNNFLDLSEMPQLIIALNLYSVSLVMFVLDSYLGVLKVLPFKKFNSELTSNIDAVNDSQFG
jgi:glycosyltransferase involved in cell wall biosynthesis